MRSIETQPEEELALISNSNSAVACRPVPSTGLQMALGAYPVPY